MWLPLLNYKIGEIESLCISILDNNLKKYSIYTQKNVI